MGIGSKAAEKALHAVAEEMNYTKADDLLAGIGAGKVSAKQAGTKLLKHMSKEPPAPEPETPAFPLSQPMTPPRSKRKARGPGIRVKGIDDVLVRLARCCNPVPGDKVIGFVTRGRGVSVHRADCPNAGELTSTPERLLEVEWDMGAESAYQVELYVEALDRMRLLQDVTGQFAEDGVNILSASTTTHRDGIVMMRFLIELGNMEHLTSVLRDVRSVDGVFEARRMLPGEASQRKNGR